MTEAEFHTAVENLLPLARWAANTVKPTGRSRSGMCPDDAYQEACVALMMAVRKYDPSRGVALTTYAVRAMTNRIRMASIKAGNVLSIGSPGKNKAFDSKPSIMQARALGTTTVSGFDANSIPERRPLCQDDPTSEQLDVLEVACEVLTDGERFLIEEVYFRGRSWADAGEAMGITGCAARARARKILKRMRDHAAGCGAVVPKRKAV